MRPVAGIVHPRRDLVDEQRAAVAQHEHLHREHADVSEFLRNGRGDAARLDGGGVRDRRRHAGDFQNMIAVFILGDVETFDGAVVPTRGDDGHLPLERHEGFEDAGLAADLAPRRRRIGAVFDGGVALAVVAEAARFQDRRLADPLQRRGQAPRAR